MLNGIDISSAQTGIDLSKITADFVIVKATESNDYTNPDFKRMANQTLSTGKLLGIYHFFTATSSVASQVNHFMDKVKPYLGKAALFLDFESTNYSNVRSNEQVSRALDFMNHVYLNTSVRMIVYTNVDYENNLNWSDVVKANHALWIAQYNTMNAQKGYQPRDLYGSIKHWPSYALFQYHSNTRLSGYNGPLDADAFYGDRKAWGKYANADGYHNAPAGPQWVKEKMTYLTKTAVYLRKAPSTTAGVIALIPSGQEIKTDQAIIKGGYRWVRQPRGNGQYGYMATGPQSDTLSYVTKR